MLTCIVNYKGCKCNLAVQIDPLRAINLKCIIHSSWWDGGGDSISFVKISSVWVGLKRDTDALRPSLWGRDARTRFPCIVRCNVSRSVSPY